MSTKIKELLDRRASTNAAYQSIITLADTRGGDFSGEELASLEKLEAEFKELDAQINAREAADRMKAAFNEPSTDERADRKGEVRYEDAFNQYVRNGIADLDAELRAALVTRAQTTATGSAGGYTVAQDFWAKISETRKAFGGLQSLVYQLNTGTGATIPWPTMDDTAQVSQIINEAGSSTLTDITFGQRSLNSYTYRAAAGASLELLQDSEFDIEALIAQRLGIWHARGLAGHLVTGTGTGQPQGIATALLADTGRQVASTGATITYDNLVDLQHAIDPAYRNGTHFALSDSALKVIRKLKDSNGTPLWQPSMQAGVPSTINGDPYIIDNGIASPGAGNLSVIYGNFQEGYVQRNVLNPRIVRAAERYVEQGLVAFFLFARADGRVNDIKALAGLKGA